MSSGISGHHSPNMCAFAKCIRSSIRYLLSTCAMGAGGVTRDAAVGELRIEQGGRHWEWYRWRSLMPGKYKAWWEPRQGEREGWPSREATSRCGLKSQVGTHSCLQTLHSIWGKLEVPGGIDIKSQPENGQGSQEGVGWSWAGGGDIIHLVLERRETPTVLEPEDGSSLISSRSWIGLGPGWVS